MPLVLTISTGMALVSTSRQRARGLEAVHARKHDVHHHQVRLLALAGLDAVFGIARGQDLMSVALQELGQDRRVGRRVLDQKNTCHLCPTPRSGVYVRADRVEQFFACEWFGEVLLGADDATARLVEQDHPWRTA